MIDTNFIVPILKKEKRHTFKTSFGHIFCPVCERRTKLYKLSDSRRKCKRCESKFTVRKKTDEKKVKRIAGCIVGFCLDFSARKTAMLFGYRYIDVWKNYMDLRIVLAAESAGMDKLQGIVEADESYFGGVNRKRNKKYRKHYISRGRGTDKSPVFGIRERNGNVQINLLSDLSEQTIERMITDKVKAGSTMMTDEFASYKGLVYKGYIHRFVKHKKGQYGKGKVHVNGMENFWNWAKEQMFKFHGVFRRNLFYYLKEMEWKFNHRHLSSKDRAITLAKLFNEKNN
ncbi:MAG: IS1595 family transposase [Bacteroidota bacterium]